MSDVILTINAHKHTAACVEFSTYTAPCGCERLEMARCPDVAEMFERDARKCGRHAR